MITKVQQDLEDNFYTDLGDVGKKTIAKYPHQPIEDLAHTLTEGMMIAYPGRIVEILESKTPGYQKIVEDAFYLAVLRLLQEAKG